MKADVKRNASERPQSRDAINAARYRKRKARGQRVYYLAAHSERLIDMLVRRGLLPDGDRTVHTQEQIELGLAKWVDEEGRK